MKWHKIIENKVKIQTEQLAFLKLDLHQQILV